MQPLVINPDGKKQVVSLERAMWEFEKHSRSAKQISALINYSLNKPARNAYSRGYRAGVSGWLPKETGCEYYMRGYRTGADNK